MTALHWLRVLFPRWNFYDQVAYHFDLEFQIGERDWTRIPFVEARRRFGLFLNPSVNLTLAHVNILEHFAQDVHSVTTYQMLLSLLRVKFQEFGLNPESFRFRVIALRPNERIELYVSDWIVKESP